MPGARIKTGNLSCRISPEHKQLIELAARRSGFSLSDFVVHSLVNAASEVLREGMSVIRLDSEEWERLLAALAAPPQDATEAMKRAVGRFRRGRDDGDRYVLPAGR